MPYLKLRIEFRFPLRAQSQVFPVMRKTHLQNGSFQLIIQYDRRVFEIPMIRDVYKYGQLDSKGKVTNYDFTRPV